jgi:hypothetical protein
MGKRSVSMPPEQDKGPGVSIGKPKAPKGMGYPLKSSVLVAALAEAGISIDLQLSFNDGHIFFDAFFWPPNPNVPYERLYVRAGAVPANEIRDARLDLENVVLPGLVAWMKEILALPKNAPRRREKQSFSGHFPVLAGSAKA